MIQTGCFCFHAHCFKPKKTRQRLCFRAAGILCLMLVIMHSTAQGRQMSTNRDGTIAIMESVKVQQHSGERISGESDQKRPDDTRKAGTQLFEFSQNPHGDHLCVNSLTELPAGDFTIQIMNIQGKLLYTVPLVSGTTRLNVSQFTSGTYMYEIRKDQQLLQTGKFIKQ